MGEVRPSISSLSDRIVMAWGEGGAEEGGVLPLLGSVGVKVAVCWGGVVCLCLCVS